MDARSRVARRAVVLAGSLSRALRRGGGSTIGGRVGLAIDGGLLSSLASGRAVALVSGTNGKTTTTRLLAEALGDSTVVATSAAGANMPAGLVAALAGAPDAPFGVLEVDEGYLGAVDDAVKARVLVALNLSRDQLDRVGEVRKVAARWREVFARTTATVVANCDDPLVVWAASAAARTTWVSAGGAWLLDAFHCPSCGATVDHAPGGAAERQPVAGPAPGWSCSCGLERPQPDAWLDGSALVAGDRSLPFELSLPGRFNRANAAMAAMAAAILGRDLAGALEAMEKVTDVAGRFARVVDGNVAVRLMLAKNPAGWAELVELIADGDAPVVVGVNAHEADGHDPSWLWDVPFERLSGRLVVATGERCRDLAVRLRHAGVEHVVVADQHEALHATSDASVDYVGNYTAFQQLRRGLARKTRRAPSLESTGLGPNSTPERVTAPAATQAPGPANEPGPAPPASGSGNDPAPRRAKPRPQPLSVVVVHPDLLGTYSDLGNGVVLVNRARWRAIPAELVLAESGQPLPRSADLYCLGGGEDGPQARSAALLGDGAFAQAVARGATVLAVCAGFQILGQSFPGHDGRRVAGLGILDVDTASGTGPRAVGEVVVEPTPDIVELPPGYRLTGFENHAGATRLGNGVQALGRTVVGVGNGPGRIIPGAGRSGRIGPAGGSDDGRDGIEGAVAGRVVATYLHGPVLARNPALADHLLALACSTTLAPLEDGEEDLLRAERFSSALGRRDPDFQRRKG